MGPMVEICLDMDAIFNFGVDMGRRIPKARLLILLTTLFLPLPKLHAVILTLEQTPGGPGKTYTLSWTAAVPSTDTSKVTYYIFSEFGADDVGYTTVAPTLHANFIGSKLDELSSPISLGVGTRGFVVVSSDSFDGATQVSNTEYHRFIHASQDNAGARLFRTDGDGTNRGVDQKWTFKYFMDDDAYVTTEIYPPGTTFNFDSNSFITGSVGGVSPTKVLVSSTPRTGELGSGDKFNEEFWDSRSSTGVIVPNGIYYILLRAFLDAGQSAFSEGTVRDSFSLTIPVDIIRIMNLAATGITQTNPTSTITYDITGDANVRVVIAEPGSSFTVDSGGNIQAVNRTTGLIDPSMVVSSFTFQRKAGSNIESWDGTSSTGAVKASGVYAVGISASDSYGNHAIDTSGNDFPIFASITLERAAGSSAGTTTASDTTAPTIAAITPIDGSSTNSPITSVVIQLADTESTLNLSGSVVTIRDPNNAAVAGATANNGSDTLTFTPTSAMQQSGTYTATIVALDNAGNSATYTRTFTVNIRLDSADLKSSMLLFPNPAKNTTATFQYALSLNATTDIDIFNILGEKIYSVTYSDTQSTAVTHTWDLKSSSGKKVGSGLYLVRIKSTGSGSKAEAIKKLVVVQ